METGARTLTADQNLQVDRIFKDLITRRVFTKENTEEDWNFKGSRKSWKSVVRNWIKWHVRDKEAATIIKATGCLKDLKKETFRGQQDLKDKHPEFFEEYSLRDWNTITTKGVVIVRDAHGEMICLKVPIPQVHIDTLEESDRYINTRPVHEHKRGLYEHRHWTCWWDFNADSQSRLLGKKKQLIVSSEFKRDQAVMLPPALDKKGTPLPDNVADRWMLENQKLFRAVSNIMRLWMPDSWLHLTRTVPPKFLKKAKLPLMAPPYIGLAMNRKQKRDGQPHLDLMDDGQAPNIIIPYGRDWLGGGDLLLHPFNVKIRVYKGEVCFFYGRWCTHNVVGIEGERNVLDLFMNHRVQIWAQRQVKFWASNKKFGKIAEPTEQIEQDDKMGNNDGVIMEIMDLEDNGNSEEEGNDEDDAEDNEYMPRKRIRISK